MPYLNKIVDELNTTMKETVLTNRYFQAGRYYGLSKIAEKEDDNTPYLIDETGKEFNLSINSDIPFSIYHRLESTNYTVMKESVGDGNDMLIERNNLFCVVYCDSQKTKTNENDLAFLISLALTKNFNRSDINDVPITFANCIVTSTNYNSKQIFKQEYGNDSEYSISGNDILILINYTVEIHASRYCLASC